jgi:Kef-type K+ transport system membrane component KefB
MDITFSFFLIFTGAAFLATLTLFARQPLILAYLFVGGIIGPFGLSLISDIELISSTGHIGIIFLLFLLGLEMQLKDLISVSKVAVGVVFLSSLAFFTLGFIIAVLCNISTTASIVIGLCSMFSSTIITIKLLPTTVLHHKHSGELIVGLLLLQDILAICVLLFLNQGDNHSSLVLLKTVAGFATLIAVSLTVVKFILLPLIKKFDRFHEFIFLIALAWCMSISELSQFLGASLEIGAFVAGITLASSPISIYISDQLKPLRNFFLIIFFFSVGASFNFHILPEIIFPVLVLSLFILICKPLVYRLLLNSFSENKYLAWGIGFRLGQGSEFSILIAHLAFSLNLITNAESHIIQASTLLTFIVSSYIIVKWFPNPIAVSDKLRRD